VTYDRFAVVRVPFPFTDRDAAKNRPALVLATVDARVVSTGLRQLFAVKSRMLPGRR